MTDEEIKFKKIPNKIILTLHHDYLMIEKKGIKIQLPVRCAKLIKDMYEARNAENEQKDLLKYSDASSYSGHNPDYELNVFVMNAKYNSSLQWIKKDVLKFTAKDFKDLKERK